MKMGPLNEVAGFFEKPSAFTDPFFKMFSQTGLFTSLEI